MDDVEVAGGGGAGGVYAVGDEFWEVGAFCWP